MTTRLTALLIISLICGCDPCTVQLPEPLPASEPVRETRFDPATAGVVTGSVTWVGDRPAVPPMLVCRLTRTGPEWITVPNPNAPQITLSGQLAGAVVFLRGVDPIAAAPWTHPPVAVEADGERITSVPGGRVGFARVGDEVEFRSAADALLGVRCRGAAFFTLMLPDRTSVRRRLDRPGRVELTSPANVYWAVADLFVCEHPYYTLTDADGRFRFENVPAGEYTVVCRLPHWEIASTERDPETGAVFRARYAPVAEVHSPVRVTPLKPSDVRIDVSTSSFPPR